MKNIPLELITQDPKELDKVAKNIQDAIRDAISNKIPYAMPPSLEDIKSSLQPLLKETREAVAKAFGGCTKCYGKGYGTATYGTRAEGDFEGERGFIVPTGVHMEFCKCPRGQQLEELLKKKT